MRIPLNFQHLQYFWAVARRGSVSEAARELRLRQPTVSAQLKQLEGALGTQLFNREGRRLSLTESGRVVLAYAQEIFSLGRELTQVVGGEIAPLAARFRIGVVDAVPKLIAARYLRPLLEERMPYVIQCYEAPLETLLQRLANHELNFILSDAPLPTTSPVRAFSHPIGSSKICIGGAPRLCRSLRGGFPRSLNGAPFLMPAKSSALRMSLDSWFERSGITPRIIAECEDSALLKPFAQSGAGLVPLPAVAAEEIGRQYGLKILGELRGVDERFFGISLERKLRHPAVIKLTESVLG